MNRFASLLMLSAALLFFVVAPAVADNHEWPRQIDGRDTTIIVYQPQLESFENDILSARAAVSVQRVTDSEPIFGAVWFEAQAETDRETRNVSLRNVRVIQSKFPDADKEQEQKFNQLFNREASGWNLDMSLDQMLAMLDEDKRADIEVKDLKNEPPKVFYRMHPALLVLVDGEPKLQPVSGSKVMRIVNSPMYILLPEDRRRVVHQSQGEGAVAGRQPTADHRARGRRRGRLPAGTAGNPGEPRQEAGDHRQF